MSNNYFKECVEVIRNAGIDDLYLSNIGYNINKKSGVCPIHAGADNKNGFSYTDQNGYRQYSCWSKNCIGEGADIIHLCKIKENLSSEYDAIKYLSIKFNIELPKKEYSKQEKKEYAIKKQQEKKHDKYIESKENEINSIESIDEKFILSCEIDRLKCGENTILKYETFVPYGNYIFENNILSYIKKSKDDDDTYIPIYDGYLNIENANIDLDEDKEVVLLESRINNKSAFKEVPKGLLLGSVNKLSEELNNKKGFFISPIGKTPSMVQAFLSIQYKELNSSNKFEYKYYTNKVGYYENIEYGLNSFVYPNSDLSLDNLVYYKKDGNFNKVFSCKGSTSQWISNIYAKAQLSHNIMVMLLGTFGSILVNPLGVHENFIIDLSGTTGTSKTTAINVCSSVFGKPINYYSDFNTTSNAIISKAVELNVFPMMIDDTKKCPDKSIIVDILYAFSGGKSKGRANKDGSTKEQQTFHNIALTTGEVPITDYLNGHNTGSGAFSRVICLDGGAFKKNDDNKNLADELNADTKKYYGSIGHDWVKWILNQIKDEDTLDMWKEEYRIYIDINAAKVKNDLAKRKANHISLLQFTAHKINEFVGSELITNIDDIINKLLVDTDKNTQDSDNIKSAYVTLMEFCTANDKRFYKNLNGEELTINNPLGQYKDGVYYFYQRSDVESIINKFGDMRDLFRQFKDREYLISDAGKNTKKARLFHGTKKAISMYAISTLKYQEENEMSIQSQFEEVKGTF